MVDIITLGQPIKSTYEAEPDTNAFTNAEKTKLAGIAEGAEVNAVDSVNGQTGDVIIDAADLGLGNVDNTSDADKPVSTATQLVLDGKVDETRTVNGQPLSDDVVLDASDIGLGNVDNTSDADKPVSTATQAALDLKQNLAPRVVSAASLATPTPNAGTTDEFILTELEEAAAFAAPTGSPVQGQAMVIRIKDNGTARALTWNAIYRAIGVTLPTTTVINKTIYITMIYNSTDVKWDVLGVAQEA
jgi:hypothetical protein